MYSRKRVTYRENKSSRSTDSEFNRASERPGSAESADSRDDWRGFCLHQVAVVQIISGHKSGAEFSR